MVDGTMWEKLNSRTDATLILNTPFIETIVKIYQCHLLNQLDLFLSFLYFGFISTFILRKLFMMKNHVTITTGYNRLPVEVTIVGKFDENAAKEFITLGFKQQLQHKNYIDEFNEQSACIGQPNFPNKKISTDPNYDPTAVYTFGIDIRDLVFHRHEGHRIIIGVAGKKGCILRFSLCTPDEAKSDPSLFVKQMYQVNIPEGRMFVLRFHGTVYHQFSPVDPSENAYFAVSVHSNEIGGLSGKLLDTVLSNEGSIPLLTEPAPENVLKLLAQKDAYKMATIIDLDCLA